MHLLGSGGGLIVAAFEIPPQKSTAEQENATTDEWPDVRIGGGFDSSDNPAHERLERGKLHQVDRDTGCNQRDEPGDDAGCSERDQPKATVFEDKPEGNDTDDGGGDKAGGVEQIEVVGQVAGGASWLSDSELLGADGAAFDQVVVIDNGGNCAAHLRLWHKRRLANARNQVTIRIEISTIRTTHDAIGELVGQTAAESIHAGFCINCERDGTFFVIKPANKGVGDRCEVFFENVIGKCRIERLGYGSLVDERGVVSFRDGRHDLRRKDVFTNGAIEVGLVDCLLETGAIEQCLRNGGVSEDDQAADDQHQAPAAQPYRLEEHFHVFSIQQLLKLTIVRALT